MFRHFSVNPGNLLDPSRFNSPMETKFLHEESIVRYLLGDLPEAEQIRLEDRAFSDQDVQQSILDAEADLIDAYVRGGLSAAERRQFEHRFLASAERRRKVEFARALATVLPEAAPLQVQASWWEALKASLQGLTPVLRFSMAAAALLLLIAVSWLLVETFRLRAQLQVAQQARKQQEERLKQEAVRSEALAAQLAREQQEREALAARFKSQPRDSASPAAFIASLFLPPLGSRGESNRPTLSLAANANTIRLQVGLESADEYPGYRVEIRTGQGREVWVRDGLRARSTKAGHVIELRLPANLLPAGKYELTLTSIESQRSEVLRYYDFDVVRK